MGGGMSHTMVHTGIIPTAIWSGAWECHHIGVVSLTLSALGEPVGHVYRYSIHMCTCNRQNIPEYCMLVYRVQSTQALCILCESLQIVRSRAVVISYLRSETGHVYTEIGCLLCWASAICACACMHVFICVRNLYQLECIACI